MGWGRDNNRYSDQVAYAGRAWQAYRGGSNEIRLKSRKFDGTDFRDIELPGGGRTNLPPTVWTDYWHQFICVGHRGTDNALYHMASGDGFSWPGGWEFQGGVLTDIPTARSYRHGRYVYTAQGTDNQRYRKVYNGSWADWAYSDSAEIALGTNLIDWDPQYADLDASLDALRGEVLRVRFGARRADILDHLINNRDLRTIIFNGSDAGLTWETFWSEINATYGGVSALDIARRYPHHNFIWELGNEPDRTSRWGGNPVGARDAAARTANTWRDPSYQDQHPNVQLGVSLPTRSDASGNFTAAYFDTFCNNGATLNAFDVVCVHGYGFTCIAAGNGDSVDIVNRVKQLTQRAIYITETNLDINSLRDPVRGEYRNNTFAETWQEIGKRIVSGLRQWDGPNGQVRGVCMFQTDFRNTDPANYRFHMDTQPVNQPLPRLGHQALGQRTRSASGCP